MFRNYRVMPIVVILLACSLVAGIIVYSLSNAKSTKAKAPEPQKTVVTAADSPVTPTKNIKVSVQNKDRTAVSLAHDLAFKSRNMTPDEVAKLEKEFEENPDNLDVAAQLLGFYSGERFKNPEVSKKREKLISSLIGRHPDAAILGLPYGQLLPGMDNCAEANKLWAQQVENNPKNTTIIMNAAAAALLPDKALAEKYLLQAQALEPDSPEISLKLAQVYQHSRMNPNASDKDKNELAAKELAELTKVYSNSDSKNQNAILPAMTKAALESPGNLDLADRNADLMISQARTAKEWDAGKLFYYGYYTKGMVAFKNGDTNKAVEFLLKSAETPASSTFDALNASGGPNMSLAKALLEAGYKDEVIEFLGKCGRFWKYSERGRLGKWTAEIKAGKTPDFGANLAF